MIADELTQPPEDRGDGHRVQPMHESFSIWSTPANGESAGGDWWAIVPISEHAFALNIGDVAGHGLTAAATMVLRLSPSFHGIHDGVNRAQAIR